MTWKELKELVDARLAELGKDDSVEIWYVDISFPTKDSVWTSVDSVLGLSVS